MTARPRTWDAVPAAPLTGRTIPSPFRDFPVDPEWLAPSDADGARQRGATLRADVIRDHDGNRLVVIRTRRHAFLALTEPAAYQLANELVDALEAADRETT